MKGISVVAYSGVTFCLLLVLSSVQGADIVVESKDNDLKSFSERLPGEKINLHSGEVDHYLETVSIEGNGLPIKLGHSFKERGYGNQFNGGYPNFKEVYLQVPELIGLTPKGQRSYSADDGSGGDGSISISHANPNTLFNCSQSVLPTDANTTVLYSDHYDGYTINNRNDIVNSYLRLNIGYEHISFFPKKYALSSQSSRFPSMHHL